MAVKHPEGLRRAVLDDMRAGLLTQGEVSRKHGVARGTISRWAADAGVESPRAGMVAAAVEAQQWDRALWRARVAEKAAERAEWVLDRLTTGRGGREVQGFAMAFKVLVESVDLLMPAPSQHEHTKGLLTDVAKELGIAFGQGVTSQDQDNMDTRHRPEPSQTTADQGEAGEPTP